MSRFYRLVLATTEIKVGRSSFPECHTQKDIWIRGQKVFYEFRRDFPWQTPRTEIKLSWTTKQSFSFKWTYS